MDGIYKVEAIGNTKYCRMKKVVIIGPESTGKSTLAEQLAAHYKTSWCAEYARQYLETNGPAYTYEDLLTIAKGQLALEDDTLAYANNGLYFIDTNMYVMQVWCEYVFGKCHQYILDEINERRYDLYLFTNIDLPWVKDDLREYPDEGPRRELYCMYKEILTNQNTPWQEISGGYAERLQRGIDAVEKHIPQSFY
jgi:NadR type nicotinamide-nucleotide adenylyltransferase